MSHHSKPIPTYDHDPIFHDALDHFTFSDLSIQDSVSNNLPKSTPSTGLRRRRLFSRSKEFHAKGYNFLLNFKQTDVNFPLYKKTNLDKLLTNEADINTSDSSTLTEDETVTVGSDNSVSSVSSGGSNIIFSLLWSIVKVVCMKGSLLVGVTHACCMFVTNPLVVMKGHVMRSVLRLLEYCFVGVKRVVYKFVSRNKFVGRMCVKVGWGVLCAVFLGVFLVGLFGLAFVVGGMVIRFVVEAPLGRVARLNFDYTRDAPVAFVPLMSCSGRGCLGCDGKIGYGSVGVSRVIPRVIPSNRKLQATVSLTLPESGYNRNLGNFQVRIDYLSSNGKPLATATQPCTMRFKSRPIRLLMTLFKLAPLITGYSLESQTVDIKFSGYTEREIPTSCVRVVLEPRAEFAKGGGIPEIYTAYLKLESQLPLLKRILWSWKATVFIWTSIAMFKLFLVLGMLCCAPWLRLRSNASLNNTVSR